MPALRASSSRCGIHVRDGDVPRTGKPRDSRRHDSDRASAGHQNVLAKHWKRQRRVHGVSEGIENRGDFVRDGERVLPHVHHGNDDKFGERAGAVHAHALRVRAQVAPAGQAISAAPANHVAFAADQVAGLQIRDVGADLDHFAAKFVADHQGHVNGGLRPFVPIVNVQVGAADAGGAGRES